MVALKQIVISLAKVREICIKHFNGKGLGFSGENEFDLLIEQMMQLGLSYHSFVSYSVEETRTETKVAMNNIFKFNVVDQRLFCVAILKFDIAYHAGIPYSKDIRILHEL